MITFKLVNHQNEVVANLTGSELPRTGDTIRLRGESYLAERVTRIYGARASGSYDTETMAEILISRL